MITIALDAMGGDFGPGMTVKGATLAVKENDQIKVILVGRKEIIEKELNLIFPKGHPRIEILHTDEEILMDESPILSVRRKKKASINIGLKLVKEKTVDAFVSAGNTGAVMAAAVLILGKIPNIERPAIATVLTLDKSQIVVLDIGSNVDCKPSYLMEFAIMGDYFAQYVLGIEKPRVGLLNIGEESEKGNSLTRATYDLLKDSKLNFVGNVESKDILFNKADIIICDGFIGNMLLKFGEGLVKFFFDFFKGEYKSSVLSKIGFLFLVPALNRFKKCFDYEEFGGAPLLGVNGVAIIAHGKSKPKAIKNAILRAEQTVTSQMVAKISRVFT
ncbi:MAG: phosphate acyltransferase PlsX [Candidatus Margulisiibacteriota bacterium]